MKTLGNVLPTSKSLACNDRFAARVDSACEAWARRNLGEYERRTVGGEVRYYDGADRYAVVARRSQDQARWFVRRNGEWYSER